VARKARKGNWKKGDRFVLNENIVGTHLFLKPYEKEFTIFLAGHAGVITEEADYFLYDWISPLKYKDTTLYKVLKGEIW